eukprot:6486157-Amphidinium_carterae.1
MVRHAISAKNVPERWVMNGVKRLPQIKGNAIERNALPLLQVGDEVKRFLLGATLGAVGRLLQC